MSIIDPRLLNLEQDTVNANALKEIVIGRLLEDKVITEEQAEEYVTKWQVIIVKYGWFERWLKSLGGRKSEDYTYKYVRF
jgi:hypothetical protein